MKTSIIIGAAFLLGACDLDVKDLNNPGIDQLEDDPSPSAVSAACTGLQIGSRGNIAQANGYVAQTGILGREAYNFDQADPRFVNELLDGELAQGSPFGGNFWTLQYSNLRLGSIVVGALPKVTEYSPEQRSAVEGFVLTTQAVDLLEVVVTRDTNGAVIDFGGDIHVLAPLVDVDEAYAKVAQLLDDGAAALDVASDEFPFTLSSGYAGFDTPSSFRTYNRALRARVAAYVGDYATVTSALAESFLNDAPATLDDLNVGVYHVYSTNAGDAVNNLINPNIYAHPGMVAAAEAGDQRIIRKVEVAAEPGGAMGLSSDQVFTIYTGPSSPVPIIRNEELILLQAEAKLLGTPADAAGATTDINTVRAVSGSLAALAGTATQDDLIRERRYSLLFEGGFSWIDARRFDAVDQLLALDPAGRFDGINIRYPIPLAECNARPGEARCELGSR
jgi:hypothetical protein